MPAPPFPIPINAYTDHVHIAGDSLVVGAANTPAPGLGILSPIAWKISSEMTRRAAPVGGWRASAGSGTFAPTGIAWTTDGISGSTLADLATNVSTRMMAYAPPGDGSNWKIFIIASPNDWGNPSLPGSWTTPADTILAAIRATKPNASLCIISSLLGFGEQWQSGAACWGLNPSDPVLAALNVVAAAWCATNNIRYMNLRGDKIADPFTIANYESLHNGAEPGSVAGPIGQPASLIHPTIHAGQIIVSDLVLNGWLNVSYS
jgi:hypothetical protein